MIRRGLPVVPKLNLGFYNALNSNLERTTLRSLLYIIPILTAIWVFDRWISDDGYVGWERNTVRNSMTRWLDPMEKWDYRRNAHKKVAILGSSTSRDWLDPGYLQRLLSLKRGSVLDAHINGCRPGCTWSEVRLMLQRYRIKRCRLRGNVDSEPESACEPPEEPRFDKVFFGTNLFPMCEDGHSKRNLQHRMLIPTTDIPALFSHYGHAEEPLEHIGRFAGVLMSEAYADTRAVKNYWGRKWLGSPDKKKAEAWIRPSPKNTPAPEIRSCDYTEENIALQLSFTAGIMDDLRHLSEMSYIMLLPEKSIALKAPEHAQRWAEHVATHQALAAERPWVEVIDLTKGGADKLSDFRDDLHLKRRAFRKQRAVFEDELERLGVSIDRARAKKRKPSKKAKKKKKKKKKKRASGKSAGPVLPSRHLKAKGRTSPKAPVAPAPNRAHPNSVKRSPSVDPSPGSTRGSEGFATPKSEASQDAKSAPKTRQPPDDKNVKAPQQQRRQTNGRSAKPTKKMKHVQTLIEAVR